MAVNVKPITLQVKDYISEASKATLRSLGDVNVFAAPKIDKVVINVGVGKYDNKQKQEIADYLTKLTAQTPKKVPSKVSIASFKVRKGDTVGLVVTLRGKKAADFIMQLVYIALPRTRDFKGIKAQAFDNKSVCYSMGIENVSIFPAIGFDTTVNFGMQVNIVFKQPNPDNVKLLINLGFPFKKEA